MSGAAGELGAAAAEQAAPAKLRELVDAANGPLECHNVRVSSSPRRHPARRDGVRP